MKCKKTAIRDIIRVSDFTPIKFVRLRRVLFERVARIATSEAVDPEVLIGLAVQYFVNQRWNYPGNQPKKKQKYLSCPTSATPELDRLNGDKLK